MNPTIRRLPCVWALVSLLGAVGLGGCGGSDSAPNTPAAPAAPALSAPVGPTRAAGCPSAQSNVALNCAGGTPMTSAQLTAIVGTYDNGSANLADQLFVSSNGNVFYGASPTAYTPASFCAVGTDAVLNLTASQRLVFTISSTAVRANGNVPTNPVTAVNNAAQSSCQF